MYGIKNYLRAIKNANRENSHKISLLRTLKYYFIWSKHLKKGNTPLNSEIPWIVFEAIELLNKIVHPKMKVFEYGSGGSTLFWARRVKEVYSIEHDNNWAKDVQEVIKNKNITNVSLFHIEPEPDTGFSTKSIREPGDFISDGEIYFGSNFEKYVKQIDRYSDDFFDIVLVDGRARPSCVFHSLKKVKVGGYLILDNSDRAYYLEKNMSLLRDNWVKQDFFGPVPGISHFSVTTLFRRVV